MASPRELRRARAEGAAAARRRSNPTPTMQAARKGSVAATGAVYGMLERQGVASDIAGIPIKPIVFFVAAFGEITIRDKVARSVAGGIADASLGIYMHEAVRRDTLIAGGHTARNPRNERRTLPPGQVPHPQWPAFVDPVDRAHPRNRAA